MNPNERNEIERETDKKSRGENANSLRNTRMSQKPVVNKNLRKGSYRDGNKGQNGGDEGKQAVNNHDNSTIDPAHGYNLQRDKLLINKYILKPPRTPERTPNRTAKAIKEYLKRSISSLKDKEKCSSTS